jgi:peptidoglycan/xylan/chitin deacetylase (PgdA/CDA1 family)
MRIILSLDYELFFGTPSGSFGCCIIEPTKALHNIFDRYGVKAVFFVDAGYLWRMNELKTVDGSVAEEFSAVTKQLNALIKSGHEVGLHIHPHWEDTIRKDGKWVMDTRRYRLHDFSKEEARSIILKYAQTLTDITGKRAISFRAGGWCIQPFHHIYEALWDAGIRVDSSVYPGGYVRSETHYLDFRDVPKKSSWRFDQDPTDERASGRFWEIPISSFRLSPLFFWQLALLRKMGSAVHKAFGDGRATPAGKRQLLRMLFRSTKSVASMDGLKVRLLGKALKRHQRHSPPDDYFVIIGHPKAQTPYSLRKLDEFISASRDDHIYTTYENEITNEHIS